MTVLELMRVLVSIGAIESCPIESDTYNCFWDAEYNGNGKGASFYRGETDADIVYLWYTE